MITKTPIVAIVGMNTLSWTTSDDERVARLDTAVSSDQLASDRMGNGGKLETTLGILVAVFLTRTGKPSTW